MVYAHTNAWVVQKLCTPRLDSFPAEWLTFCGFFGTTIYGHTRDQQRATSQAGSNDFVSHEKKLRDLIPTDTSWSLEIAYLKKT